MICSGYSEDLSMVKKMSEKECIGYGTIEKSNGETTYVGNMPFENGDEVIMMKMDDFRLLIENDQAFLKQSGYPMEEIEAEQPFETYLPDEFVYTAPDGTKHRLFLDLFVYGAHPKDEMWIRYVSVDQALVENDECWEWE